MPEPVVELWANGGRVAVGNPLPVDISESVTVEVGTTVEVTNDTGNPLPVRGGAKASQLATIANGASLSDAVDLTAGLLVAVQMPAAWTAAVLTFQASHDGVTFADVYDSAGAERSVAAAAGRHITLDSASFGIRFVKIRSGTAAAAVAQGAERQLRLITVPL